MNDKRRQSDPRLDQMQTDHTALKDHVCAIDDSVTAIGRQVDDNTLSLRTIAHDTEPLQDIADGVRGLRSLSRVIMFVGGLAGGIAAILAVLDKF